MHTIKQFIKTDMKKGMKLTMKERVLRWVERRGSATFTDIQRFIVDFNMGYGTYDSSWEDGRQRQGTEWVIKSMRRWRGYYANHLSHIGYLRQGDNRLEKTENGQYIVKRDSGIITAQWVV